MCLRSWQHFLEPQEQEITSVHERPKQLCRDKVQGDSSVPFVRAGGRQHLLAGAAIPPQDLQDPGATMQRNFLFCSPPLRGTTQPPKPSNSVQKQKKAPKLAVSQPQSLVCPQNKTYCCHMHRFVCSTFSLYAHRANLGRF